MNEMKGDIPNKMKWNERNLLKYINNTNNNKAVSKTKRRDADINDMEIFTTATITTATRFGRRDI